VGIAVKGGILRRESFFQAGGNELDDSYAIRAIGRVRFDRCAGVNTILAGTRTLTLYPGVQLTANSAVVATLQGYAGARTTTVSRVIVNTTNSSFTIYLTADTTTAVKVAWHVFE
jgi:hypothetical protein